MSDQTSLFDMTVTGVDRDHALARMVDPTTSQMADAQLRRREGEANKIKAGSHRHYALACFAERGALIAEDVKFITGRDGIWKRVSDLKNMKFIEATGETRTSREGRQAEVYVITESGLAAYARLGRL